MASKAVTTTDSAGMLATLSDDLKSMLAENANQGLEDVGLEGFALPFIKLLQALSPEVQRGDDSYIDGAAPGHLYDSVTRELFDAIEVVPAHVRVATIEWAPRNQGGGFIAEYGSRDEAEEMVTPGNELKDTITYTVLYRPVGDLFWRSAMISFDSTKLKIARSWNTQLSMLKVPVEIDGEIQRVTPPIFMTRWVLGSARQENAKGKFYNFSIRSNGLVDDVSTVELAKQLREAASTMPVRGKDGDLEEPEIGEGGDDAF